MSYEAGSSECKKLIDAKESIITAMNSLENINKTEETIDKLRSIYKDLDQMHDRRREYESKNT
tara:strand:- start:1098 stop:1286 length:189 start_codon:yes stop_codon:yes gene_type:complete